MSEQKTQPAELKIPGVDEPIELPIYSGNLGPDVIDVCLLYTSPSPRDYAASRMPSSA